MEVPEVLHELWSELFAKRFERTIKIVSSIGLLFVVLGVAGELSFERWRSGYEGLLQDFENILLVDAERHAASAQQEAGDARDSATKAASASILANGAATNAVGVAHGAREEADSFERDIVSAKNQAAAAESHLAEALKQAADATAELNKLKSPRTFAISAEILSTLRQFPGTEYTFSMVAADPESVDFLKQIDGALRSAEWKRVKPDPPPMIGMKVFGDNDDFRVTVGTLKGVKVEIGCMMDADGLKLLPPTTWPQSIKLAGAVINAVTLSTIPSSEGNVQPSVGIVKGASEVIRISVGSKP